MRKFTTVGRGASLQSSGDQLRLLGIETMKEFPPFHLDTVNQCLWRRWDRTDQERVLLTPRAYALLRYLVDHPGRLLTHAELLDALWPNTHVQAEVLKSHIFEVRTALGDDSKKPLFIETLPRRGYRFIAPVSDGAAPALSVAPATGRLVGRDRPLAALREALQRAVKGERQIVFVTGEPGIGKTALVDEFQRQAALDIPDLHRARTMHRSVRKQGSVLPDARSAQSALPKLRRTDDRRHLGGASAHVVGSISRPAHP
jgi:DNA-binding winged helix-turn-helix (wHTH) protein